MAQMYEPDNLTLHPARVMRSDESRRVDTMHSKQQTTDPIARKREMLAVRGSLGSRLTSLMEDSPAPRTVECNDNVEDDGLASRFTVDTHTQHMLDEQHLAGEGPWIDHISSHFHVKNYHLDANEESWICATAYATAFVDRYDPFVRARRHGLLCCSTTQSEKLISRLLIRRGVSCGIVRDGWPPTMKNMKWEAVKQQSNPQIECTMN